MSLLQRIATQRQSKCLVVICSLILFTFTTTSTEHHLCPSKPWLSHVGKCQLKHLTTKLKHQIEQYLNAVLL